MYERSYMHRDVITYIACTKYVPPPARTEPEPEPHCTEIWTRIWVPLFHSVLDRSKASLWLFHDSTWGGVCVYVVGCVGGGGSVSGVWVYFPDKQTTHLILHHKAADYVWFVSVWFWFLVEWVFIYLYIFSVFVYFWMFTVYMLLTTYSTVIELEVLICFINKTSSGT